MALVRKEISSQLTWDAFVLHHAPQALFQSWDWGETERKLGHTVWRYGWFDGATLVGVAQVQRVRARRGTFLHIRHGPILRTQKKSLWKEIFKDLAQLARVEHAWFLRVSPQIEDTEANRKLFKDLGLVSAPIHAMDAEICWVLDLTPPEEELLATMRKTTRYEIKQAQKLGVTITKSREATGLTDFFSLYGQTSERHGFVQHTGIREELETMDALLISASYQGRTLASAIILFWGQEAIYHHGASIPSKIPASYLLQWEAIREAKKRGKKLYNFWGIAPENNPKHPWRGITVFKKGFGGQEVNFLHAHDLPVSPLYVIPKVIEGARRRLKGY